MGVVVAVGWLVGGGDLQLPHGAPAWQGWWWWWLWVWLWWWLWWWLVGGWWGLAAAAACSFIHVLQRRRTWSVPVTHLPLTCTACTALQGGGPVRTMNLLAWGVDLVEEQLLASAGGWGAGGCVGEVDG